MTVSAGAVPTDAVLREAARAPMDDVNRRFARSLDTGDHAALREVFTCDATYRSGARSLQGIEQILAAFEDRHVGTRITRHVYSGLTVLELDVDAARTVAVWTCFASNDAARPAPMGVFMVADFHDDWRRQADGGWRIASRVIEPIFRDASLAPASAQPSSSARPPASRG